MALICVVDDEPVLLTLIAAVLRLDGHDVRPFGDPLEAYAAIAAPGAGFALLLTDAEIKPISGIQLGLRVRAKRTGCHVLLMAGRSTLVNVINQSLGYRAAIGKPFTAAELRAAVQRTLTTGGQRTKHVA